MIKIKSETEKCITVLFNNSQNHNFYNIHQTHYEKSDYTSDSL